MSSSKEIKTFEDLKVWQRARELRNGIFNLSKRLPDEERYRLKDQLIRSSRSVTVNISEGYGRFHYQEYIQYCRQARGSVYEILDHLICAEDQGFINSEELGSFRNKTEDCVRLLNGFIRYLKNAKGKSSVQESDVTYGMVPEH